MNEVTNRTIDQKQNLITLVNGIEKSNDLIIKLPDISIIQLDENFLIGLIEGDGCFNISFGEKLQISFHITQHITYLPLLEKVKELLGCGRIIKKKFYCYKTSNP
jgi:hypothetical protein